MGIFGDIFGAKKKETTTTQAIPDYMRTMGEGLASKASNIGAGDYKPYTGKRVAEFTPNQTSAFQGFGNLYSGRQDLTGEALEGARAYGAAPAQSVGTERLIDEGGQLGAIKDYMSPYLAEVLGPMLREIDEGGQRERTRIGGLATGSGSAYGDARHGVLENELNEKILQSRGDATGKTMQDAFMAAMGMRSGDANRMLDVGKTNAGYTEQALERGLRGSGELLDRQGQDEDQKLQLLQAMLGAGTQEQGQEQQQLDSLYEDFLRSYGHDTSTLASMMNVIKSAPYSKTNVVSQDTNPGMEMLGSILGALASGGGKLPSFGGKA